MDATPIVIVGSSFVGGIRETPKPSSTLSHTGTPTKPLRVCATRWPGTPRRELLDKEKNLNSVNVSTPDHMHAPITMRAMQQGLHVYTQKPLTQTLYEARQLTRVAREKKLVT